MDQITHALDPAKFRDPLVTVKGEMRATVALRALADRLLTMLTRRAPRRVKRAG